MVDDVEQVRHEIRFALNQLRVRNGQHEFETLTRMLARATVTRNLLPATGPVAGGGDQGRDFETFPTQLPGQVQRIGRDLGVPDRATVGFACTLQQGDLRAKIRADVAEIVASGSEVEFIVAYCEADISVARRHAIERDAMERHRVRLAVFDGNAIAELLADHATFWIAETYLHLPARVLPCPLIGPTGTRGTSLAGARTPTRSTRWVVCSTWLGAFTTRASPARDAQMCRSGSSDWRVRSNPAARRRFAGGRCTSAWPRTSAAWAT